MSDELLNAVIRLENQIQQQLQQEQARADTWLAGVRNEQEECGRRALQELEQENAQILAADGQSAEHEAGRLVEIEECYSRRLEKISDQVLSEVLGRQLTRLLPGAIDDHKDVQS
jgi:vacuolar-type H+-ATPase subunit H